MSTTENEQPKLTFIDKVISIDTDYLAFLAKGEDKVWLKVNGINKNKMTLNKDNYGTDVEAFPYVVYGDRFLVEVTTGKVLEEELAKRVTEKKSKGSTPPFGTNIRF